MGTTYTVSSGNCPSRSCATSSSLLMLAAGPVSKMASQQEKAFCVLGWIWLPCGCVSCDQGCTHWRIVINACVWNRAIFFVYTLYIGIYYSYSCILRIATDSHCYPPIILINTFRREIHRILSGVWWYLFHVFIFHYLWTASILSYHLCVVLLTGFLPSCFPTKLLHAFISSICLYMPAHFILLYLITLIFRELKYFCLGARSKGIWRSGCLGPHILDFYNRWI